MFEFYVILKRSLINLIIKDRATISLYLQITGYPLHLRYNDTMHPTTQGSREY